jgi:hypothetical protein
MTSQKTRDRLGVYKHIKNCRTETVSAMVEPDIFHAAGRAACEMGISKSAWLRELVLNELDRVNVKIEQPEDSEYYQ